MASSRMISRSLPSRFQVTAAAAMGQRNNKTLGLIRTRPSNIFLLGDRCRSYHVVTSYFKSGRSYDLWGGVVSRSRSILYNSNRQSLSTFGRDWKVVLSDLWSIQKPKEGSGFDHFIPKKQTESKGAQDANTSPESGAKEPHSNNNPKEASNEKPKDSGDANQKKETSNDPFKNFGSGSPFRSQQKDSSSGGGSSSNNDDNYGSSVTTSLILLALALLMMRISDRRKTDDPHSRDISWKEFVNSLVETNQVEKVVISSDKATAMVFLRPGAPGLPDHRHGGGDGQLLQGRPSIMSTSTELELSSHSYSTGNNNTNTTDHDTAEGFTTSSPTTSHQVSTVTPGHRLVYRLNIGSVEIFERKLQEAQRELGRGPSQDIPVQYATESSVAAEIFKILPGLIIMAVLYLFVRSALGSGASGTSGSEGGGGGFGGIFKIGKSTATRISKDEIKVRFADVAGCDEAKKEIMEFVEFLKNPDQFTKLGAKIPKGALLCGPPGTGKTLLAKAVAGEAGVPFFSISGSNFVEMFVGVGPARVRDLFRDARKEAPCIVFIDEIDAVGRKRSRGGASNDESENTLNQLLVEMDGFSPSTGVVILAATNRVDILDQALVRPGRFDRQVLVDRPDLKGRRQIFMVHLRELTLADEMENIAGRLAGLTPGFVGADIANICNEAAIIAARRDADTVALEDFEKAIDRNIGGMESNKIMSKEVRNIVAHHEAGHAVAGWFLEYADPLLKATIIPRSSGALGFAQYLPKEVFLRSEEQIMDIVCMALAGRASEEVFFGSVTTGAADDLRRVTGIVYQMIQVYGMNPRLGQLAFPKDPNAYWDERPYSEKTAKAMDEEAKSIVDAAYQRSVKLIREKKDLVEKVAATLLAQETITHSEIVDLIGPRPFEGDAIYKEFIERRENDPKEETKEEPSDTTSPPKEGDLTPGLAQ